MTELQGVSFSRISAVVDDHPCFLTAYTVTLIPILTVKLQFPCPCLFGVLITIALVSQIILVDVQLLIGEQ